MNPLKQGLKLDGWQACMEIHVSLSMNPLKQGLKQHELASIPKDAVGSLSMNPLKQGLKRENPEHGKYVTYVFIHESIKTRVETRISGYHR